MEIGSLSIYDLRMMHKFNCLYMCQAVSVYEKLIQTKDDKFANRVKLRIDKINSFANCEDKLNYIISELSYKCKIKNGGIQ